GEGASLSLEDIASALLRRPSPGSRRPGSRPEQRDEWERYKRCAYGAMPPPEGMPPLGAPPLGTPPLGIPPLGGPPPGAPPLAGSLGRPGPLPSPSSSRSASGGITATAEARRVSPGSTSVIDSAVTCRVLPGSTASRSIEGGASNLWFLPSALWMVNE